MYGLYIYQKFILCKFFELNITYENLVSILYIGTQRVNSKKKYFVLFFCCHFRILTSLALPTQALILRQ